VSNRNTTQSFCVEKCGLILIISRLRSEMDCGRICYMIYHLASNLLPHYLANIEYSTVELHSKVIQFISVKPVYLW